MLQLLMEIRKCLSGIGCWIDYQDLWSQGWNRLQVEKHASVICPPNNENGHCQWMITNDGTFRQRPTNNQKKEKKSKIN